MPLTNPGKWPDYAAARRSLVAVLLVSCLLRVSSEEQTSASLISEKVDDFSISNFSSGIKAAGKPHRESPSKVIVDGRINANQTEGIFAVKPPTNHTTGRRLLQSKCTCTPITVVFESSFKIMNRRQCSNRPKCLGLHGECRSFGTIAHGGPFFERNKNGLEWQSCDISSHQR